MYIGHIFSINMFMKNKIIKLFTEAPLWNDQGVVSKPQDYDWSLDDRTEREEQLKHFDRKNDVTIGDISYTVYEDDIGGETIYITARKKDSNEPLVGELSLEKNKNFRYPYVLSVHIIPEARGMGIGSNFYNVAVEKYGGLVSDRTLSGAEGKGSFNIWQNLSKKYNPYLLITNQGKRQIKPVKQFDPNVVMGDDSIRLVVSKKPIK